MANHSNRLQHYGDNGGLSRRTQAAEDLTNAELRARFLELTDGTSCLIEEPLDTGLWPTAGLSDDEIELLTESLRSVRQRELA